MKSDFIFLKRSWRVKIVKEINVTITIKSAKLDL